MTDLQLTHEMDNTVNNAYGVPARYLKIHIIKYDKNPSNNKDFEIKIECRTEQFVNFISRSGGMSVDQEMWQIRTRLFTNDTRIMDYIRQRRYFDIIFDVIGSSSNFPLKKVTIKNVLINRFEANKNLSPPIVLIYLNLINHPFVEIETRER